MIFRIISIILVISTIAFAHLGKTDANDCYTNKKTGEYHCHNKDAVTPDAVPQETPAPLTSKLQNTKPPVPQTHTSLATDRVSKIIKLDYLGFTVWLDCAERGAIKFQYNVQRNTGNVAKAGDFYIDPNVPADCQQTSSKAYGHKYDRGYLVSANHLDGSSEAIKATNSMTNILPQAANMNRGAWLQSEKVIEFYRDIIDESLVIGGVIWGNNPADDYFVQSHSVKTPDAFWKVLIHGKGQDAEAIAWIIPNSQDATQSNLDSYLVTVDDIERLTGEKIPVADYAKHKKPPSSMITLTPEEKSIINAVNAFKKALSTNNISNVLPLIVEGRRPYYQNLWKDGKNLSVLAQRMQNIMKPKVGNGWAEVYVLPPTEANNQNELYILDFEQGPNGIWYLISY